MQTSGDVNTVDISGVGISGDRGDSQVYAQVPPAAFSVCLGDPELTLLTKVPPHFNANAALWVFPKRFAAVYYKSAYLRGGG